MPKPSSSARVDDRPVPTSTRPPEMQVEHGDRLGGAHRVVVGLGHEAHAVAEADALGQGGDGAVEHLGVRAVAVLLEEVVLDGPERVPAPPLAGHRLLDRVAGRRAARCRVPRPGDRDLVEQGEAHRVPPSTQARDEVVADEARTSSGSSRSTTTDGMTANESMQADDPLAGPAAVEAGPDLAPRLGGGEAGLPELDPAVDAASATLAASSGGEQRVSSPGSRARRVAAWRADEHGRLADLGGQRAAAVDAGLAAGDEPVGGPLEDGVDEGVRDRRSGCRRCRGRRRRRRRRRPSRPGAGRSGSTHALGGVEDRSDGRAAACTVEQDASGCATIVKGASTGRRRRSWS